MRSSRYCESRTLVRRLGRLPGEDRADYRQKITRLREHFERFNVDASELCQWLMGLRRRQSHAGDPASFGVLGDSLLEPELEGVQADDAERDRWRLAVFDDAAGIRTARALAGQPVPATLRDALAEVAASPRGQTARLLFDRLRVMEPAHRLVLLKSAAEWVVARYRRGVENWVRQREEWEKEKDEWEKRHPALTPVIRDRFTAVFKSINDPERSGKPGLRRKNPRICPCDRLRQNIDNCRYAGEKGHGPLCWKFIEFVKARKAADAGFNDNRFVEDAERLLLFCVERKVKPSNALLSPHLGSILFKDAPPRSRGPAVQRLKNNWTEYLKHMVLNAETVLSRGRLPHCRKIGGETFEKSKCPWNPHTALCLEYKRRLGAAIAEDSILALESDYREWRRLYLAGPRKPLFKYPSSRELPMPKIFGEGFHQIDFDRSILRLRLDDMVEGQWLEFGFTPWPRGYRPSRSQVKVTSIHINFIGRRARAGFRFDIRHQESRFACSQDELDELRSRRFPRQSQDQQFINAARTRLLRAFRGDADRELRLLAVDLGEKGAHAAFYEGRAHRLDVALPIVKINRLYTEVPETLEPDSHGRPAQREFPRDDPRGLRKEHVGRHLSAIANGAAEVAVHRQQEAEEVTATLREHDFRGLKRHITWMIRDWARHNAARIIAIAEEHRCDLIVFESLRGFRLPGYEEMDEAKKRRLAMFAFGRIRRKVVEKAVERGMRVITAPFHKSSRVCSACGHVQENEGLLRKNKAKREFVCERKACARRVNSDANAARVLARVFWGEITLPDPQSGAAETGLTGEARGAIMTAPLSLMPGRPLRTF